MAFNRFNFMDFLPLSNILRVIKLIQHCILGRRSVSVFRHVSKTPHHQRITRIKSKMVLYGSITFQKQP